MKINIAGYNIDSSLIKQLDANKATPEVISAAYARISRSNKSVTELRVDSLEAIEKARKSNDSIIFGMGHSSIAEHAVFNIDLLDVSRFITELIQKSRLASFTEKSQRYVTLKSSYLIPEELPTELKAEYLEVMDYLFTTYNDMFELAKEKLVSDGFEGSKRDLEGKAKEDARYILPLATHTQMGVTINARNLERLLKRLDRSPLVEAKKLKNLIYDEVKEIAPSVIKYVNAEEFDFNFVTPPQVEFPLNEFKWSLVSHTSEPDIQVLAYILFEQTGESLANIKSFLKQLSHSELKQMFSQLFNKMKGFHLPTKAFESVEFEFEFDISSSCFAQLKRHRIATIIKSAYSPENGYVIPPQLVDLGLTEQFSKACSIAEEFSKKLPKEIAPYVLTNSHKVKVLFKANLREFYHFSRLRSDAHAQWEIQDLSNFIVKAIQEVAPLSGELMMGKHEFNKLADKK